MQVSKFVTTTIIITTGALVYVSQQTALVRLSYDIKEKQNVFTGLLDRNKILLYNVKKLESPLRLEGELLARKMKLEIPSHERVILVSATTEEAKATALQTKSVGVLGRLRQAIAGIFTLGPEAQAGSVEKNRSKK